jgi:two-component system, cell cycle response regulator
MDAPTSGGDQILVIEDNKTNRELMVYLLNAFGYSTCEAENGRRGLEMVRERLPRLVICDVQVPELDGYGIIRELKLDETLRRIPVVAVTALAMVGDRDRILAAGFDGYVAKPIAPETFVDELEKFLPVEKRVARDTIATPALNLPAATPDKPSPRKSRGTVLVVDDIPENLEFARSTLEPSGYTVFTADNVESALELLRKKKPDVLLCDLHMQPQDGFDLLDRTKTDPDLRRVPVAIISSTSTEVSDALECLERGAAHFIRRPIEPEMLLAEIDKMMRGSRLDLGREKPPEGKDFAG